MRICFFSLFFTLINVGVTFNKTASKIEQKKEKNIEIVANKINKLIILFGWLNILKMKRIKTPSLNTKSQQKLTQNMLISDLFLEYIIYT